MIPSTIDTTLKRRMTSTCILYPEAAIYVATFGKELDEIEKQKHEQKREILRRAHYMWEDLYHTIYARNLSSSFDVKASDQPGKFRLILTFTEHQSTNPLIIYIDVLTEDTTVYVKEHGIFGTISVNSQAWCSVSASTAKTNYQNFFDDESLGRAIEYIMGIENEYRQEYIGGSMVDSSVITTSTLSRSVSGDIDSNRQLKRSCSSNENSPPGTHCLQDASEDSLPWSPNSEYTSRPHMTKAHRRRLRKTQSLHKQKTQHKK